MNARSLLVLVAGAVVVSMASAPPSAAFLVQYNYYCYATYSDGIPITDHDILTGENYVDGDYIKMGAHGNYGSATFCADIHAATVSVRAHSHGVALDPPSFPTGTGRVERCRFQDRIYFTVPAGYYPDGVQISVRGVAIGSLGSDVGAGAKGRCYASFGGENFDTGVLEVGVAESGTIFVNESFELTAELVDPGTTLSQEQVYDEVINVSFTSGSTWSTSYNPGGGSVIGDGDINFTNGLRLTALTVPAGVVWTSESGVFPDLPTSVRDDLTSLPGPRLHQNHPNPFNPQTTISFSLDREELAEIGIYELTGCRIAVLATRTFTAGPHYLTWNGRDSQGHAMPSGTYIVRLETESGFETRKVMLVR